MVVNTGLKFQAYVGYLKTGLVTDELEIADVSVELKLNTFGTINLKTPALEDMARVWRITTPWERFLAVTYGGVLLEAGMIVQRSQNAADDQMSIEAHGLWSVFDRRMTLNRTHIANGGSIVTSQLTYRNLSLGSIAQRLCKEQVEGVPNGYGALPIDWSDEQKGVHEANYRGYNIKPVGEVLRNIARYKNGPDIRFKPRFSDPSGEKIRWLMEFGSNEQPLLFSRIVHRWDARFVDSAVEVVSGVQDATNATNTVYEPGTGEELERRIAVASNLDFSQPGAGSVFLETLMASKQVDGMDLLTSYAQNYLDQNAAPFQLWDVSVRAEISPILGSYLPGDFVSASLGDSLASLVGRELIVRIMGIDARASGEVRLSLAPLYADGSTGSDKGDNEELQAFKITAQAIAGNNKPYVPRQVRPTNPFEEIYSSINSLQQEDITLEETNASPEETGGNGEEENDLAQHRRQTD